MICEFLKSLNVFVLIWVVLVSVDSAQAEPVVQILNASDSQHRFSINSEAFGLSGTFKRVSGRLDMMPNDFSKSRVFMRVDISAVALDPLAGGMPLLSFEPLFRRIPAPVGTFSSSRIISLQHGNYRIDGIWERNGKREDVSVPIRLISSSANESKILCKTQEQFSSLEGHLSLPLFPAGSRGELSSQLTFRAPHAAK